MTRLLAVLGVAGLVAELLAICLLRYEHAEAIRPLTLGAAAVCGMALVQFAAAGPRGWRSWFTLSSLWFWLPLVAYAAAVTASARLAQPGNYPRIPIEAWWFAGLAVASAQIGRTGRGRRFTLAILITALFVLMPGVFGAKSGPDLSGRFLRYSALVQWGAYPEIGLLGLFGASAALAIALTGGAWAVRLAAAILAALFAVVPFAVNSRGAVLALVATAGWLVAVVALRGVVLRSRMFSGRRRIAWLLVGIVCLTGVAAGAAIYRARIARIASAAQASGDTHAASAASSRFEDWRVALNMIADHPLFGVGPGRFPLDYRRYSSAPPENHAHNMLLHVGAEAGLLGLIPFVVIWGRLLWLTLRASSTPADGAADAETRREVFVWHALVAAFFIRALTDQFLSSVHSSFRATLLMAIVVGLAQASTLSREIPLETGRESDG